MDRQGRAGARMGLIRFDEGSFEETEVTDVSELESALRQDGVKWLNVTDASADHELVKRVAETTGIHPLALDDVLHVGQRPRSDEFGDHIFVLLRMLLVHELAVPPTPESANGSREGREAQAALESRVSAEMGEDEGAHEGPLLADALPPEDEWSPDEESGLGSSQVALVLKEDLVITFLETSQDPFEMLRERLRESEGPARAHGADFLVYRLIDVVISQYFTLVEQYGDSLDALEDAILRQPTHAIFRQVNGLRSDLLLARRAIWPLRDALTRLEHTESDLLGAEALRYLRDSQSHVVQVIETLELLREMITGLHDIYLTALNTRMNDVIKVLTIISTIFIPLTFLAGIYGMNFEHQPEYRWPWAYPALWGVMIVLVVGMLLLFRRKRWL